MDDDANSASTPAGLLQCLRMLSEEASTLRLDRTFAALQDAIEVCRRESGATPRVPATRAPVLH